MHRSHIRGVTAVLTGTAGVLTVATAIGLPALAASREPAKAATATAAATPPWVSQRAEVISWDLPNAHPLPAPRVRRATAQPASRSSFRAPLQGSPQEIAHQLVLERGWSEEQFGCLSTLWYRESAWDPYAANSSGAYGIPQALPGYRMASFGSDWQTNPVTQIRWGLWYIADRYGTPCAALQHSYNYNFY